MNRIAIVLGLLFIGQPSPAVAEDLLAVDPLDTIANSCPTPQALAAFLRHTFHFQSDPTLFGEVDRWQSPAEFVSRKRGDCEDYALLAQAVLRRQGIEAYVFSVFGAGGYAHTVCVFRDERGRYNVFNQDRLRYYRATSLEAVASQLCPTWTMAGIAEQAGARGRFVWKITNPRPESPLLAISPFSNPSFH